MRSLNSQHFISFHLMQHPLHKGIWRWSNDIHSAHLQLSRRSPTWIWRCFGCSNASRVILVCYHTNPSTHPCFIVRIIFCNMQYSGKHESYKIFRLPGFEVFQITFFNLWHSGAWYRFIMLVFTISALCTSWSWSVVNYGPQRSSLFTITEPVKHRRS